MKCSMCGAPVKPTERIQPCNVCSDAKGTIITHNLYRPPVFDGEHLHKLLLRLDNYFISDDTDDQRGGYFFWCRECDASSYDSRDEINHQPNCIANEVHKQLQRINS